jgi:flagellar motor switch protein FliM
MTLPQIRPFDFSRLKKVSSRYVAIMEGLLQAYPQFAQEGGRFSFIEELSKKFKVPLEVSFLGLEEKAFKEFKQSISPSSFAVVLQAPEYDQKIFVELDSVLVRGLLSQALTGQSDLVTESLPLTPLEAGVLDYALAKILFLITQASQTSTSLKLFRVGIGPHIFQEFLTGTEVGCQLKCRVTWGNIRSILHVYLPHPLVEGIFLSPQAGSEIVLSGMSEKKLDQISHLKTQLWAEVGRVQLMSSETQQLEKNDVILFDETFAVQGEHGLTGKAILRAGESSSEGVLTEIIDTKGKMTVKVLDFYGGE